MCLSLSSSTPSLSHPHPIKGVPKNFANFTGKHRCFPVKLAKFLRTPLFTEHLRWLLLSMLIFVNVSSFTSPLPHFHYFLTVLLLSLFEETLSSLYHYYYIITVIIAEWFVRTAATATTYCTAISMIVIGISALRHTGIPGLWTQELDAELWKLDSGCWTLNAGGWILDSWHSALDYRH